MTASRAQDEVTSETISGWNLTVSQPRRGYRYNMDPFFLTEFVELPAAARVVDLGTGVGIIALLLARRHADFEEIVGIEIQDSLAELAAANVRRNRLENRIRIIHGDFYRLKEQLGAGAWTTVVSNPPYYQRCQGRLNRCSQKAIARHELTTSLAELAATAGYLLKPGGEFYLIYPAERTASLLAACTGARLTPKKMQCLHPRPGQAAELIMLQARKDGNPGLEISAPRFIHP